MRGISSLISIIVYICVIGLFTYLSHGWSGNSVKQTVAKLRRLADCLESGKPFQIQIAGERISVPASAIFNIEHEREGNRKKLSFNLSGRDHGITGVQTALVRQLLGSFGGL